MNELRKDIKNRSLGCLYLFTGEERYLLNAYEKAVINTYLPDFSDMNLSVFEGKQIPVNKIIDAAETLPFMSNKRIVIVRDSGLFTAGRKDDSDLIAEYLTSYKNDSAILIFIESNIDKRLKAYKALIDGGKIVTFAPLSENELVIWHNGIMKKNNLQMSSKDAVYLFRLCAGDMDTILRETEKLISYKKEGKLNREDIDALCTKTNESKVYDLVDAISSKDLSSALRIYNDLLLMKETPIGILAMISKQLRLILRSGLLKQKGYDQAAIARILNERPFSIKTCLSQSRNFSSETLKKAALEVVSCDTRIKSGIVDGRFSVEALIIKFSS